MLTISSSFLKKRSACTKGQWKLKQIKTTSEKFAANSSRLKNSKSRSALFVLTVCLLANTSSFLTGCRTGQPRDNITPLSKEGTWSAKTMVRDKKQKKTHQLDLEFVALRPKKMRMEVTTPGLGIHVASFVLN